MSENQALASAVVARLRAVGVRTFCVCPGGRNAPLVEVLEALAPGCVEVLSFFDERSAGFFALGRARRDRAPVAVVTTSGTAAAELLPALVEAYYSAAPIVAVTADRPRAYRRTGSPQAIEQVGLFGVYATRALDLEAAADVEALLPLQGPAHLNVCFAEPLLAGWQADDGPAVDEWRRSAAAPAPGALPPPDAGGPAEVGPVLAAIRHPLVIVGGLQDPDDSRDALCFCRRLGAPALAEASSGIQSSLGSLLLRAGDASAQRGFADGVFDGVFRLGDVPSFRAWRDLELAPSPPVVSISRKPWPGLTRGVHLRSPAGARLIDASAIRERAGERAFEPLFDWDRRVAAATDRLLASHPLSEPGMVHQLSGTIPAGSFVYLGNSLPIREWNQFATVVERSFTFGESRGANGIDGQVSTFLGGARPEVENWAVIGDLTALYDLSSLWALRHLEGVPVRVVVINNGGGRIFKQMFRNERFQNLHATGFEAWAAMWGAEYHAGWPVRPLGQAAVIELRPDEAQTDAFWAGLAAETRQ